MKTLYKFIGLFIISSFLIFTACEDTDQTYTGDPFIYFSDDAITIPESSSDIVSLSVLLADAPAKSNITVSIDVQLTAAGVTQQLVEGVDFEVLEPADLSTVTIPAGENSADIQIAVFDNIVEDSAKYITLTLASAGDFVLGYPGSEAQKTAVITISDDDCALIPENFTGSPVGSDIVSSNSASLTFAVSSSTATTATYGVTGVFQAQFDSWGETVSSGATMYLLLDNTDPLNPTVSIVPDDTGDAYGGYGHMIETNGGEWGYYFHDTPGKPSTFSTCNKTVTYYYSIDLYENGSLYGYDYWTTYYFNVTFE